MDMMLRADDVAHFVSGFFLCNMLYIGNNTYYSDDEVAEAKRIETANPAPGLDTSPR